MIGKLCLTIEVVFHITHLKESILQEHLLLTGEIPPIIVVMIVDCREEGDMLMREEDLQRERDTQAVTEDLQGEEDYPVMEDPQIDGGGPPGWRTT